MSIPENNQKNPLLDAALAYAQSGWRVLPLHTIVGGACTCEDAACKSSGKHPVNANGSKGATTDEATIRQWWTEAPNANVGIATGLESGLFMIGPDGEAGKQALAELEAKHGQLPLTPRLRSGGGGEHRYFKYPATGKVKTGANYNGLPIDVRGEGGLVVAPPSLHKSGHHYEWLEPLETTPLADAPGWLLDWLKHDKAGSRPQGSKGGMILKVQADDLTSGSGVSEGQRHQELLRLVGLHLKRGETVEHILPLAHAWAGRCQPPMDASEVERVVHDLAAKEQQGTLGSAAVADDIDAVPMPLPPPWPVLDPAALHGLAGDCVRTIEPATEADPVALLLQLLVGFGNVIGRTAHFCIEGCPHHANLFACLVGESSRGRKGTAKGRILQLFDNVDGDWLKHCQAHGLSSGEGLIWNVRDAIEKTEPVKDKGNIVGYQQVVVDQGVSDKRLLVLEAEFAQTLKVLSRETNTLSAVMRAAWDAGDLRTLVKHNAARATDAHISIVGHITRPELLRHLHETEMWNGFANRFLWALVRRSKLLPDGGDDLNLTGLQQRITEAVVLARQAGKMKRTAGAGKMWHQAYAGLTQEKPGLYGAVTARAEAQVLRLSLLYAMLDRQTSIDVPHLEAALALWRFCDASAAIIFGQADPLAPGPLGAKVLAALKAAPNGMNRRELYQHFQGHIKAEVLIQALAALRDKGLIEAKEELTGGRKAERWFARSLEGKIGPAGPLPTIGVAGEPVPPEPALEEVTLI